jgi:hypothetical protein
LGVVRGELIPLGEIDNTKEEDWLLETIHVRQCMVFISMKNTDVISIRNEEELCCTSDLQMAELYTRYEKDAEEKTANT